MDQKRLYSNLSASQRRAKNEPAWQQLFKSQRFLMVALVFLLVALSFPIMRQYSQNREVEREIADMKNEVSQYQNQNQDFKEMIDYLQSDASLEEQARLNLGLKKPDEEVAVVNYPATSTAGEEASSTEDSSRFANWERWLKYFFN